MILVDTSVWVDHLRDGEATLVKLLHQNLVCTHPMVIGELACGNLHNRKQLLALLHNLPSAIEARPHEVLAFVESHQLMGKGVGFIDLQLLASCLLSPRTTLWTRDKRLTGIANTLNLGFTSQ